MKFTVSMKDPDCLHDAIREAVSEEVNALKGLDEEEGQELVESRAGKVQDLCGKWFGYGEYLVVEVDTDAMTCTVIPRK